jgi:hypothetical protein
MGGAAADSLRPGNSAIPHPVNPTVAARRIHLRFIMLERTPLAYSPTLTKHWASFALQFATHKVFCRSSSSKFNPQHHVHFCQMTWQARVSAPGTIAKSAPIAFSQQTLSAPVKCPQ